MIDLTITRLQLYTLQMPSLLICATTLSCGVEFSAVLTHISQVGKLSSRRRTSQNQTPTTVWLCVRGRKHLLDAKHCPCIGFLNPQQSYEVGPDQTPPFQRSY